ncbi:MAG: outer membrane protein assembly factor BamE [Nitrospinota bacterium]|nr:MAG: outer membrane protein assembly factor BamE [Nitrospinota bacterium]
MRKYLRAGVLLSLLFLWSCSYGYDPELDQQKASMMHQVMTSVRETLKIRRSFDEDRIGEIRRGETTRQEILHFFGEPFFKTRTFSGQEEWSYRYVVAGRRERAEINLLLIRFADGVVQDYRIRPFFR